MDGFYWFGDRFGDLDEILTGQLGQEGWGRMSEPTVKLLCLVDMEKCIAKKLSSKVCILGLDEFGGTI